MIYKVVFSLSFILTLFACGGIQQNGSDKILPSSSGKYGEVLVVVDSTYENRKTGEALQEIFYKALEGLPQKEAQFRMSTVEPDKFRSILKRSRNILKLNIEKGRKTNIKIEENVWAKNQLLIQITAASDEDAARILRKNTQTIRNYYNEKEIERLQAQFSKKPNQDFIKKLKTEYGLYLKVPPGFVMMENNENGFWIKKEKQVGKHQIMQGLAFYSEPYTADSLFNTENMIETRDEFTKPNIQGTRENSYMTVYQEYEPVVNELNLNNSYSKEFRGLWNMENDFMGGPFIHYVLVDEQRNRLVHLDGFVYAPKFNKREYVRELEALIRTIRFPKEEVDKPS
jgi:hypothetical protein